MLFVIISKMEIHQFQIWSLLFQTCFGIIQPPEKSVNTIINGKCLKSAIHPVFYVTNKKKFILIVFFHVVNEKLCQPRLFIPAYQFIRDLRVPVFISLCCPAVNTNSIHST